MSIVTKSGYKRKSSLPISIGFEGYNSIQNYIIKNILPMQSLCCIYGQSGTFKSFLAISLGCSIACGKEWSGNKVKQGAILYIAGEGGTGVPKRIKAWFDYHNINSSIPLFVINRPVFPLVKEDVDELKLACLDAENEFGMKVSLIIIDTLARCLGSADENSAKDMGAFISGCDKLKGDTGASILIVHHTGKDESRGARGSSALTASLDCEFFISKDGKNGNNQSLIVECTKMKDMEPPPRKAYALKNIELYYDQEQELISSLTVVDEPYEPRTQQLPNELKGINNLTKNHVVLFETIKKQLNENQICTKNIIKQSLKKQGIKNIDGGYYKWLEKLIKEDVIKISIIDNQSIELIK
ncbi:AAA family ATPase [Gilliamella apicola]|uniref:AAA family ATPase n=1 Tax=Gilliamella apicola TaxID=1196095 RepID=A0A556RSI0_9GAMM|nr:helicase RepA family protein [Gilliamella apicola]TSJ91855.1 AAA family ATPase [Gilliamella apicola]